VNTSHWVHTNEADFKKGTFRNVVATNLGDLKLSRAVKTIVEAGRQGQRRLLPRRRSGRRRLRRQPVPTACCSA
jgi:hypothetical protein